MTGKDDNTLPSLSSDEIKRYARHITLKEIGGQGQKAFKHAKVLIVGLGGLGAPAALYLSAAGIGRIGLMDYDKISLSNLQRQVLYHTSDIGRKKTNQAQKALQKLNPYSRFDLIHERLTPENAEKHLSPYTYVLDASDNFKTRHLINKTCYLQGKTLISGAVSRWLGQIGVFKAGLTKDKPISERLPCYQCFVPDTIEEEESCETLGILGALTGFIGTYMALETLKEIAEVKPSSAGKLIQFETDRLNFKCLTLHPDPNCSVCNTSSSDMANQ